MQAVINCKKMFKHYRVSNLWEKIAETTHQRKRQAGAANWNEAQANEINAEG